MAEPAQIASSIARETARPPAPPALSEAPTGPHQSVTVTVVTPVEKFADKAWRFLRNALTGGIATAVLYAVYLPMVWALGDEWNVSAGRSGLIAGAVVQFLGCRYFVFRAAHGALRRQVIGFILAELVTLGANVLVLHLAQTLLPDGIRTSKFIPLATTCAVFVFFSYPVWHWVFKAPHTAEGVREVVARETQRMQKKTDAVK
ncbi:MAG: GtrA family protein [Planctomycetes bacterium]|nr:GtrA family protein [Planctomycetota bacterium]